MAEWSNAAVLKTAEPETVPGVRIPLLPPLLVNKHSVFLLPNLLLGKRIGVMPKRFSCFHLDYFYRFSLLESKEVLWSRNIEAQLLQSMFLKLTVVNGFPCLIRLCLLMNLGLSGGRLYKEGVKSLYWLVCPV